MAIERGEIGDLQQALAGFTQGVQKLQLQRAIMGANEQVEQIRDSEANERDQRQAFRQVAGDLTRRFMEAGVTDPAQLQAATAAFAPPKLESQAELAALGAKGDAGARQEALEMGEIGAAAGRKTQQQAIRTQAREARTTALTTEATGRQLERKAVKAQTQIQEAEDALIAVEEKFGTDLDTPEAQKALKDAISKRQKAREAVRSVEREREAAGVVTDQEALSAKERQAAAKQAAKARRPISAVDARGIHKQRALMQQIDRLLMKLEKDPALSGIIKGRAPVKNVLELLDEDFAAFRSQIDLLGTTFRVSVTGAQAGMKEIEELMRIPGRGNQPTSILIAKLRAMRQGAADDIQLNLDTLDQSGFNIDTFRDPTSTLLKAGVGAGAPPSTGGGDFSHLFKAQE